MADLMYTRRIPGLVWLRAGIGLTGGLETSLKPVWLYGCVRRWAAGFMGYGVYVLWMPEEAGRCSVRERDANNRLVPCREKAVTEETIETTACMDRGERHFSTLRYCRGHRHMAAHTEDTP